MTTERWQKVKEIFHSALLREPASRQTFLAEACGDDVGLRREVESLITAHEKDGSFIDAPAYEVAATMLTNGDELSPGQKFGHYEVLSTLGKGGMGEVYLAEDSRLGRQVALKFLSTSFMNDPDRLRRFEQEARSASALNQPSILTIHEIGETDGRRFIATEYIEGETLRQRLVSGPLTLAEGVGVAEQVASALEVAHAAGIIHRDIKPENIMLRRDGLVKVLDFGLAKLTEQKAVTAEDSTRAFVETSAGMVMGTVAYMSPEQARGLQVDARTDIWSLGVVLYEMISGNAPFSGPSTSDVLVAVLERDPPSLSMAVPGIPETVDFVVMKALTKERSERYQTSRELLTDLRRVSHRLSAAAELEPPGLRRLSQPAVASRATTADTPVTVSSRPKLRRPLVLVALLLATVVIAGALVWKGRARWFSPVIQTPVVLLMDSTLPDRVYDPETRKNGGTNADDITDILRDLPIIIQKENTSPLWHREDQILREKPALIVIHRSCFADATLGFDPQSPAKQVADKKVESFLGYVSLGNPSTKFLTYTRNAGDQTEWVTDLEKRFPELKGRVVALTMPGGPHSASFREAETKKLLRQHVKSILGLP